MNFGDLIGYLSGEEFVDNPVKNVFLYDTPAHILNEYIEDLNAILDKRPLPLHLGNTMEYGDIIGLSKSIGFRASKNPRTNIKEAKKIRKDLADTLLCINLLSNPRTAQEVDNKEKHKALKVCTAIKDFYENKWYSYYQRIDSDD